MKSKSKLTKYLSLLPYVYGELCLNMFLVVITSHYCDLQNMLTSITYSVLCAKILTDKRAKYNNLWKKECFLFMDCMYCTSNL